MSVRFRRVLSCVLAGTIALDSTRAALADVFFRHVPSAGQNAYVGSKPSEEDRNTVVGTGDLKVMGPYSLRARTGNRFSLGLDAVDPKGAVTWRGVGAPLPAGLAVGTDGVITGYPTEVVRVSGIQVEGKDESGRTGRTQPFTIDVRPAPSVAVAQRPPVGAGDVLDIVPRATEVYGSAVWGLAEGVLPAGLTVDRSTGRISGRPDQKGVFPGIRLSLVDSEGARGVSNPFSIEVTSYLTIAGLEEEYRTRSGTALAPVRPYVVGAQGAVTWSLSGSSPDRPAWLRVDAATGVVTGTPRPSARTGSC